MAPTWAGPGLFCFAQGSEISSVMAPSETAKSVDIGMLEL